MSTLCKDFPLLAQYRHIIEKRDAIALVEVNMLHEDNTDPARLACRDFENEFEPNWANNVLGLRKNYNLPLNDLSIQNMSKPHWKTMVKSQLRKFALHPLCKNALS